MMKPIALPCTPSTLPCAELEASLGELDRCRAIYELAIGQVPFPPLSQTSFSP